MNSTSPIQPRLLSRINERLIMRVLQQNGPSTRAELSKAIGITFPTVTKAVASLLDSNLLEEFDEPRSGPGRPAKRLRLATENAQVIGITLSDSACRVTAAGLDGVLHEENCRSFATPATYRGLLSRLASHAKKLMPAREKTTLCIGISVPGIVDYPEERVVLSANLPIVNEKQIGRDVQSLLDVECIIVRDAHAFSLSERLHHTNGEALSNVAMLDHSEGIGLGLLINMEFMTGNNGYSGELGHIPIDPHGDPCRCGKHGCLETVASEWALEAKVSQAVGRPVKVPEILQRAKEGDQQMRQALESMSEHLALGVACVVNIFNPGLFYIYGQCFQELPELFDLLIEKTEKHALAPSFAACKFAHATGGELEGTVASVINYLTDSLVPNLDDYVRTA